MCQLRAWPNKLNIYYLQYVVYSTVVYIVVIVAVVPIFESFVSELTRLGRAYVRHVPCQYGPGIDSLGIRWFRDFRWTFPGFSPKWALCVEFCSFGGEWPRDEAGELPLAGYDFVIFDGCSRVSHPQCCFWCACVGGVISSSSWEDSFGMIRFRDFR